MLSSLCCITTTTHPSSHAHTRTSAATYVPTLSSRHGARSHTNNRAHYSAPQPLYRSPPRVLPAQRHIPLFSKNGNCDSAPGHVPNAAKKPSLSYLRCLALPRPARGPANSRPENATTVQDAPFAGDLCAQPRSTTALRLRQPES
ncbi:uncharacterized protein K452DRAFT_291953 [Aplosporella prunicola CBS 121167]|uniref:Uncharacterized protein n=1 Tax=Aplosporella prunicola CBS 121167 TaxID=1176127 RepID=A0A6A6B2U4_9PEZI|nr:uncharacterized protein K452DRAFT_291953 [Aplosporella prunicola CBS 121167]KAF2137041.1 hypothetical protein K452DRAFT_291953 [Aplosporella prunicola CBS 121167]